ncbi:MAG: hypothetical protein GY753_14065 [Gammaproteobacteria bacterium]|nr:hypothetical protein [Gammaproteobacteria bacterium]
MDLQLPYALQSQKYPTFRHTTARAIKAYSDETKNLLGDKPENIISYEGQNLGRQSGRTVTDGDDYGLYLVLKLSNEAIIKVVKIEVKTVNGKPVICWDGKTEKLRDRP